MFYNYYAILASGYMKMEDFISEFFPFNVTMFCFILPYQQGSEGTDGTGLSKIG
jgi:hypothetical protein